MFDNKLGFTYTSYELLNEDGTLRKQIVKTAKVVDYKKYLKNTIIGCSTVILNRDIVGDFLMYKNDTSDDMTLWLSIMKNGFYAHPIEEVLMRYRIRKNSASSNKLKAACDVWKVNRECEHLSFWLSFYCFTCYAFNVVKNVCFELQFFSIS